MSDLQDLIHTTSMKCLERGKLTEQERIIELLGTIIVDSEGHLNYLEAVALIKGESE